MVLWFIGLSGSGKSTIGEIVYKYIKTRHPGTVLLDGDVMREVWGDSLGHTVSAREINAKRISFLSEFLARQNIKVIACVLSIFPEWQQWNREHIPGYVQIHLDTPLETVKQRDVKGLYQAAINGNNPDMVGIDIPFPEPYKSDMKISAPQVLQSPTALSDDIIKYLEERNLI